jgi:hypothetical protein
MTTTVVIRDNKSELACWSVPDRNGTISAIASGVQSDNRALNESPLSIH